MNVSDLMPGERHLLFGLMGFLVEADGRIDPAELAEIDALAKEMGHADLVAAIADARAAYPTEASLLELVPMVKRLPARHLIRTLLRDLAQSDGETDTWESALLENVEDVWSRQ